MKKVTLASIAVVIALLCLWFFGRPAYRRHRETRAIEQARSYLAKADYRNVSLSARQALRVNPLNLEACRIMADLAERSRSPYLLDWQRRIVEAAPTVENKLRLASSALRTQAPPYPLAAQTLEDLKDSATNSAAYHAVSAELALRLRNPSEALIRFHEASRLEPTNELHQLNLAVLQLQSTNTEALATARATLERLRTSTNVGAVALRWLVAESLGRNDLPAAEQFSRQLLADPRSQADDRLQHLTLLQKAKSPEFTTYLGAVQKSALTNAVEVYGLSAWMISHGLTDHALAWLTNCPAKLRGEQPVPLALVDCYLAKRNWEDLESFLQDQKWGDLEFLRLAFLSRTAAEQNQKLGAEARWRNAVREAGDRLGPLTALLSMATSWGRQQDSEDLLWQIAQRFPKERWALRELERGYLKAGNTRGLNRVTRAWPATRRRTSRSRTISRRLRSSLIEPPEGAQVAKQVFSQHPEEAIVASTYAYSLHLQGRTRDGLAALEKLKVEALETPSVALYYGLLLTETGETNKAARFLTIAQKSELLPEEKALVSVASRRLAPRN